MFEPAIPPHLQRARTRQKRIPDGYMPPFHGFVARFKPSALQVVMAYFGVQYEGDETPAVGRALRHLSDSFCAADGPGHWDRASCVDQAHYTNVISAAYWDSLDTFERWLRVPRNKIWWEADGRLTDGVGYFREIYLPQIEDFETIFSAHVPEGIAVLAQGMSGEVQEHAYWGGARDRIPLSQVDALESHGAPMAEISGGTLGKRIQVTPHENLCLIRSGQDWGDADETERRMYLEDVEPQLAAGMLFLRDKGKSVGCYANRFVRILDSCGQPMDKTYSISLWRGLADLEQWAERHPTHLSIFAAAQRYMQQLGPAAKLRLYHEVAVLRAQNQSLEYVNCHDRTGMMNALRR